LHFTISFAAIWDTWFGARLKFTLKMDNKGFVGYMVYSTRGVLSEVPVTKGMM